MTNWRELRDVYGSATEVPLLLGEAASETDWDAPVWTELWGRLCHQGTVTPASYASLPVLTGIAASRRELPMDPALFLAAAIVAATDAPAEVTRVRERYLNEIVALRTTALHKLGIVDGRADFLYALQTLAAFEDLSVWQRELEGLVNEELEVECPSCAEHLYLEVAEGQVVVTPDPDILPEDARVRPREASDLGTSETRLLDLCRSHRQVAIASELIQLFGHATCPNCSADFSIDEAVA
jgi:hypothetical protein